MGFVLGVLLALSTGVVARTAHASTLFTPRTMDRACAVHVAFQAAASNACVKLVRSEPFKPDESPMPKFPDAAKEARVEGDVSFHLVIGSGCAPEEITIDDGPEMLRKAVEDAVKDWKYCGVPEGQEIRAAIAFRLNCPSK